VRIFLRNLVLVKRERNEKEKEEKKKNLPWFLLIKSLLLNQSLFWGRHRKHLLSQMLNTCDGNTAELQGFTSSLP